MALISGSAEGCRAGEIPFGSVDVVTRLADDALWVRTANLTGNGDLDLLSASRSDNTIAWLLEPTDTDASHGSHNAHSTRN